MPLYLKIKKHDLLKLSLTLLQTCVNSFTHFRILLAIKQCKIFVPVRWNYSYLCISRLFRISVVRLISHTQPSHSTSCPVPLWTLQYTIIDTTQLRLRLRFCDIAIGRDFLNYVFNWQGRKNMQNDRLQNDRVETTKDKYLLVFNHAWW